jgi:hypothetical protein
VTVSERDFLLIDETRPQHVRVHATPEGVRLAAAELERALGYALEPEGLCKGAACFPVRDRARLVAPDGIDLAALAEVVDRPLALDLDEGVAVLGASAGERARALASLDAPDFELPDWQGRRHALSSYRGRKVLIVTWASW